MRHRSGLFIALAAWAAFSGPALAQKAYGPGVTDTEIKIGMTAPLSGAGSSYNTTCQLYTAYFKRLNEEGGINGRKIDYLCRDDAYSPPKTVEQTRKLVESDGVFVVFSSVGTATNTAVQPYLASKKVPQLLIESGASKWADPARNPWTTSSLAHYSSEARIFAARIMLAHPDAKVGVLYQNDDFGKDYIAGLRAGFGEKSSQYLKTIVTQELTDPTVDSQILQLHDAGVDIVVLGTLAKGSAQAIRKIGELGWKPEIYLSYTSTSIDSVLKPAGLDYAKGVMATAVSKLPDDPAWINDPGMIAYKAFMAKYLPSGDISNTGYTNSYTGAEVLLAVLRKAGDNLTRENIRELAQNIDFQPTLFSPGIHFKTTPQDLSPVSTFQFMRFNGSRWILEGEPVSARN